MRVQPPTPCLSESHQCWSLSNPLFQLNPLLCFLLLVSLSSGMALLGGSHFRLSWPQRGCFGSEPLVLCASQGLSLVKLNSFLFSSIPLHTSTSSSTAPLLVCSLMLLRASFQTFSRSDNPILLGLIFSHILMNWQDHMCRPLLLSAEPELKSTYRSQVFTRAVNTALKPVYT